MDIFKKSTDSEHMSFSKLNSQLDLKLFENLYSSCYHSVANVMYVVVVMVIVISV